MCAMENRDDAVCRKFSVPVEYDMSNWMTNLDPRLHDTPLHSLAIPGSHDSFADYLDKSSTVSSGEPQALSTFVTMFGGFAKNIIHSWSVTQSLNAAQQLNAGVRFFDIRLSRQPGAENLCIVHGIHGSDIETCLDDVDRFLQAHPKEVVLLDFKHFHNVTQSRHEEFSAYLLTKFGSRMCPVMENLSDLTLNMMWSSQRQLVVFYGHMSNNEFQFWPEHRIHSPWPNVTCSKKLLEYLTKNLDGSRPPNSFYVTQGVLTPDVPYICGHLTSNLKQSLAVMATPRFTQWLSTRRAGWDEGRGVNICMVDFIELGEFVRTVVQLNWDLAERQTNNEEQKD